MNIVHLLQVHLQVHLSYTERKILWFYAGHSANICDQTGSYKKLQELEHLKAWQKLAPG